MTQRWAQDQVRAFALALPEAHASSHTGRPDLRVRRAGSTFRATISGTPASRSTASSERQRSVTYPATFPPISATPGPEQPHTECLVHRLIATPMSDPHHGGIRRRGSLAAEPRVRARPRPIDR